MGTTSTYFGGSGGGGGNIGSSALFSYFPLDTELPLYLPYKVTSSTGIQQDYAAGNPLGNNYSGRWTGSTGFQLRDNTWTTIATLNPANVNAAAVYFGGAAYLSNGNIVLIASDSAGTPTFYFSEFDYTTGSKAVGGLDGSITSGIARSGFGSGGGSSVVVFDGTNYRFQSSDGWWTVNSTFTSIIQEGYSGASNSEIIAANGISLSCRAPTTSTAQTRAQQVRRPDRSSDIPTQTGSPFSVYVTRKNNEYAYSPFFSQGTSNTGDPQYVAYPDGQLHGVYRGVNIKVQEFDAMMAEFQTKYVDVWEA
jgi:hypothetical protein